MATNLPPRPVRCNRRRRCRDQTHSLVSYPSYDLHNISNNFKEEFEFDMSGIELVAQGDNYNRYFVSRVERGSPADELGVQNGDELIGLNFNAVSKFTFEEVIKFLSSKDGRTIYIEFARDGKSFAGVMTLKKRI